MKRFTQLLTSSKLNLSKKLIVAFFTLAIFTTTAFAADVNYKAVKHFKDHFKNVSNVTWVTTRENYTKVSFEEDGTQMEVFYNNEGEVVASSKKIELNSLPAKATARISKRYSAPEYIVKECIELTNDDETASYVSLFRKNEKIILKVDQDGNVSEFKRSFN